MPPQGVEHSSNASACEPSLSTLQAAQSRPNLEYTVYYSTDKDIGTVSQVANGTFYGTVTGNNPASGSGVGTDYPVYNVTWYDAAGFRLAFGGFGKW